MAAAALLGLDRQARFLVQVIILLVGGVSYYLGTLAADAPDESPAQHRLTR